MHISHQRFYSNHDLDHMMFSVYFAIYLKLTFGHFIADSLFSIVLEKF